MARVGCAGRAGCTHTGGAGVITEIRPYQPGDWDDICRIHDAARLDELRGAGLLEAYLDLAATYENEGLFDGEVWVAVADGRIAGFLAGGIEEGDGEITWLYVDPDLHRHGVGRALVEHFAARCDGSVELEVLAGNAARDFYEALGFTVEATTTGKLAGNEAFTATGHTLVRRRGAASD